MRRKANDAATARRAVFALVDDRGGVSVSSSAMTWPFVTKRTALLLAVGAFARDRRIAASIVVRHALLRDPAPADP